MKAAQLCAPRDLRIIDTDPPRPDRDQVLFHVEGCGLCGSNLPPWRGIDGMGYPLEPGRPGHEAWGVVTEVGDDVATVQPGQRVTALSYGAFGEYDVAAADVVIPLPPELDGQPVPGEPIACAVNVAERAGVQEGDTVVLVGFGFLSALLLPLLRTRRPARIIAVSRRDSALGLAAALGADEAETYDGIEALVQEVTGGTGADVVIEATGEAGPLDIAAALCRVRGRLVVAGYHQGGRRSVDMQVWNRRGLDVINAHERDPARYVSGMREGVHHIANGTLDIDSLITHVLPLAEIGRAFELADQREADFFKAMITMNGASGGGE